MEFLNYLSNRLEERSDTYRKMNQGMKDIDFPFYKIFSAAAAGSLLAGCYRGVVPISISTENSQGSNTNNSTKESGFNPETKNIPKVEAPLKEEITKAFKLCGDCKALGIEENDIRGGYFGNSDFLFIATDKYGFDRTWLVQGSNVITLDYGSDLDPTTGKITWYAFSQPGADISQETYVPKVYFEWVPGLEDEYHNHFIYYQPDGTIFTRQEFILPSSLGLSEFITENPVDVPAGFVDPSEEFNKTQEEIATTSAYTLNGITGKLEYTNPDRSISIVDGISDTDKNGIFEIANTDGTETEATIKTIDENSITLVTEDGTTWRIENGKLAEYIVFEPMEISTDVNSPTNCTLKDVESGKVAFNAAMNEVEPFTSESINTGFVNSEPGSTSDITFGSGSKDVMRILGVCKVSTSELGYPNNSIYIHIVRVLNPDKTNGIMLLITVNIKEAVDLDTYIKQTGGNRMTLVQSFPNSAYNDNKGKLPYGPLVELYRLQSEERRIIISGMLAKDSYLKQSSSSIVFRGKRK